MKNTTKVQQIKICEIQKGHHNVDCKQTLRIKNKVLSNIKIYNKCNRDSSWKGIKNKNYNQIYKKLYSEKENTTQIEVFELMSQILYGFNVSYTLLVRQQK